MNLAPLPALAAIGEELNGLQSKVDDARAAAIAIGSRRLPNVAAGRGRGRNGLSLPNAKLPEVTLAINEVEDTATAATPPIIIIGRVPIKGPVPPHPQNNDEEERSGEREREASLEV